MTIKAPRASSIPDLYYGKYVSSLFSDGEQGVWYDASDMSTMFQDAAGTTPVTAVEQPVGLILDKSKNGVGRNGAKRVNLLRRTRQLQDTAWTKINNVTVTDNYGLAPDGTNTATRVQLVRSPSGWAEIFQRLNGTLNLKVRMWLKALAGTPTIATTYDNSASSYKNIVTLSQEWTEYEFDIATAMTGGINLIIWGDLPQTSLNADFLIWNPDVRLTSEANTQPKYQRIDADWPSTIPGNHATQTTTASRPVLSSRVNLLQSTENLADSSYWGKYQTVATANFAVDPFGNQSAALVVDTTSTSQHHATALNVNVSAGVSYKLSLWVKKHTTSSGFITFGLTGQLFNWGGEAAVNLNSGSISSASGAVSSTSISDHGNGWFLVSMVTIAPSTGVALLRISLRGYSWESIYTGDGLSGVYLWGADLRVANESPLIPNYQRVNTATDYDTQGFPLYLRFDGVDDWLATPSVDFTAANKMTVFAGIRKLSDAAPSILIELGSIAAFQTAGTFNVTAPESTTVRYAFYSRGSVQLLQNASTSNNAYLSPVTNIIVCRSDIARDLMTLNINGAQAASNTADQGTGSYSNYPLFIGRRGGTQLPFNGRLYGLVVRGAQTDDLHLTNVERYLANKSGVVL